jgi:hypothetical protein
MIGEAQIQSNSVEPFNLPGDWQQLAQENGSLRAIIAELLIKNQNLRWELMGHKCGPAHEPRLLVASEGTPLRRNSRTAVMP